MNKIVILYYSRHGSTRKLAREIAQGVESIHDCVAVLRTVPEPTDSQKNTIPIEGDLYISIEDLENCDALILGSPTRFGNMASALHLFFESTSTQWLNGSLSGKPAAVFTSSSSMHGGQESTLLNMMLPLLHHGMLLVGIPYAGTTLGDTQTGGTPYGASHVTGPQNDTQLSQEETSFAITLGKRVASVTYALQTNHNQATCT